MMIALKKQKKSLIEKLGIDSLKGKTFLDIGSGSGLFSLAAYLLGAKVYSFDYDVDSVACTKYLQEKYAKDSNDWSVQQGSVLDKNFLQQFGTVDILYSWGVLHHTGNMHQAFANVAEMVSFLFPFIMIRAEHPCVGKKLKKPMLNLVSLLGFCCAFTQC